MDNVPAAHSPRGSILGSAFASVRSFFTPDRITRKPADTPGAAAPSFDPDLSALGRDLASLHLNDSDNSFKTIDSFKSANSTALDEMLNYSENETVVLDGTLLDISSPDTPNDEQQGFTQPPIPFKLVPEIVVTSNLDDVSQPSDTLGKTRKVDVEHSAPEISVIPSVDVSGLVQENYTLNCLPETHINVSTSEALADRQAVTMEGSTSGQKSENVLKYSMPQNKVPLITDSADVYVDSVSVHDANNQGLSDLLLDNSVLPPEITLSSGTNRSSVDSIINISENIVSGEIPFQTICHQTLTSTSNLDVVKQESSIENPICSAKLLDISLSSPKVVPHSLPVSIDILLSTTVDLVESSPFLSDDASDKIEGLNDSIMGSNFIEQCTEEIEEAEVLENTWTGNVSLDGEIDSDGLCADIILDEFGDETSEDGEISVDLPPVLDDEESSDIAEEVYENDDEGSLEILEEDSAEFLGSAAVESDGMVAGLEYIGNEKNLLFNDEVSSDPVGNVETPIDPEISGQQFEGGSKEVSGSTGDRLLSDEYAPAMLEDVSYVESAYQNMSTMICDELHDDKGSILAVDMLNEPTDTEGSRAAEVVLSTDSFSAAIIRAKNQQGRTIQNENINSNAKFSDTFSSLDPGLVSAEEAHSTVYTTSVNSPDSDKEQSELVTIPASNANINEKDDLESTFKIGMPSVGEHGSPQDNSIHVTECLDATVNVIGDIENVPIVAGLAEIGICSAVIKPEKHKPGLVKSSQQPAVEGTSLENFEALQPQEIPADPYCHFTERLISDPTFSKDYCEGALSATDTIIGDTQSANDMSLLTATFMKATLNDSIAPRNLVLEEFPKATVLETTSTLEGDVPQVPNVLTSSEGSQYLNNTTVLEANALNGTAIVEPCHSVPLEPKQNSVLNNSTVNETNSLEALNNTAILESNVLPPEDCYQNQVLNNTEVIEVNTLELLNNVALEHCEPQNMNASENMPLSNTPLSEDYQPLNPTADHTGDEPAVLNITAELEQDEQQKFSDTILIECAQNQLLNNETVLLEQNEPLALNHLTEVNTDKVTVMDATEVLEQDEQQKFGDTVLIEGAQNLPLNNETVILEQSDPLSSSYLTEINADKATVMNLTAVLEQDEQEKFSDTVPLQCAQNLPFTNETALLEQNDPLTLNHLTEINTDQATVMNLTAVLEQDEQEKFGDTVPLQCAQNLPLNNETALLEPNYLTEINTDKTRVMNLTAVLEQDGLQKYSDIVPILCAQNVPLNNETAILGRNEPPVFNQTLDNNASKPDLIHSATFLENLPHNFNEKTVLEENSPKAPEEAIVLESIKPLMNEPADHNHLVNGRFLEDSKSSHDSPSHLLQELRSVGSYASPCSSVSGDIVFASTPVDSPMTNATPSDVISPVDNSTSVSNQKNRKLLDGNGQEISPVTDLYEVKTPISVENLLDYAFVTTGSTINTLPLSGTASLLPDCISPAVLNGNIGEQKVLEALSDSPAHTHATDCAALSDEARNTLSTMDATNVLPTGSRNKKQDDVLPAALINVGSDTSVPDANRMAGLKREEIALADSKVQNCIPAVMNETVLISAAEKELNKTQTISVGKLANVGNFENIPAEDLNATKVLSALTEEGLPLHTTFTLKDDIPEEDVLLLGKEKLNRTQTLSHPKLSCLIQDGNENLNCTEILSDRQGPLEETFALNEILGQNPNTLQACAAGKVKKSVAFVLPEIHEVRLSPLRSDMSAINTEMILKPDEFMKDAMQCAQAVAALAGGASANRFDGSLKEDSLVLTEDTGENDSSKLSLFETLQENKHDIWNLTTALSSNKNSNMLPKDSRSSVLKEISDNVRDSPLKNMGGWLTRSPKPTETNSVSQKSQDPFSTLLTNEDFDFLNEFQPPSGILPRESLYVKFDPLFAPKISDSTIFVEAIQSSKIAEPSKENLLSFYSPKKTMSIAEMQAEITRLRELYVEREKATAEIEAANKQKELEEVAKCEKLRQRIAESEKRIIDVTAKLKDTEMYNKNLADISEMYKQAINEGRVKLENDRAVAQKMVADLTEENESISKHLASAEAASIDVYQKYTKFRWLALEQRQNQISSRLEVDRLVNELSHLDERILSAESAANHELAEIERIRASEAEVFENDLTKLKMQLRKAEVKQNHMEDALQKKTAENRKLTDFCDELIAGSS